MAFIENHVPAGYTFGELHDAFVGATEIGVGLVDWPVNILSMFAVYPVALATEVLRTVGILDQPSPPNIVAAPPVAPVDSMTHILQQPQFHLDSSGLFGIIDGGINMGGAAGGYVLYPGRANANMMQNVYRKSD